MSEKTEALKKARDAQKDANKELDNFASIHEFAMADTCKDKTGEKTKVLILNTDKEGYIGLFLELGNPFTMGGDGQTNEDSKKIMQYMKFMVNVDLDNAANQKAVGLKAISKARATVVDFFMLHLVSSLRLADVTGNK